MRFWLLILLFTGATINATEIGEISEFRGNGEILRNESGDKLLAELALDVFSYDDVRTGNGRMAIEFLDSSILKLTEHSKVVIDNYIFDPDPSKSKLALNMASGTARFITGALGRINKENISIRTPSATIAIRGTDFTTTVDELGRSLVILLPDANGQSSGEITVTTWSGVEVLNQPFQATMVSTFESRPTPGVVLDGLTLGLIDNMLIVNKPPEVQEALAEQEGESKTELDKDFFEDNIVDLMDFDCDQRNNVHFFYVLPFSKNKAMIETTWLSKEDKSLKDYDSQMKNYINRLGLKDYKISFKEEGAIPLFHPLNEKEKNKINIGTAGGMTRLSTGYTFLNIQEHSKYIRMNINNIQNIKHFEIEKKYRLLDKIFLKVLDRHPEKMPEIFFKMFNSSPNTIIKFLSNKSNLFEDLSIIFKMPKWIFIKALLKS